MAIQIRNTQSVQRSGPTNASVRTQAPASAFGSLENQAAANLGDAFDQSISAVADAYAVREEEDNLRIAKRLEREYVDMQNLLMDGDGTTENVGYLGLRGEAAMDSAAAAAAQLQAHQDSVLAQYADNDRITELYTESTSSRIDGAGTQIFQHQRVQRDLVIKEESTAYKDMRINESLIDYANQELTDGTLDAIAGEISEIALISGDSAEAVAADTQKEQSAYLLSLVQTAGAVSSEEAIIILAENVVHMTAVDANAAKRSIEAFEDDRLRREKAARTADEKRVEDDFDARQDFYRIQQASNGEWDEEAALAEVVAGTMRVEDFESLKTDTAPSSAAAKEASGAMANKIIDDMRNGVDVSDWRNWGGLLSDDHAVVAALEHEIDLAGGSWMLGSEDLVGNIEEAMLPADFNKFTTTPQDTIAKQRAATRLASDLLKEGYSQDDVYTMVVGAYATDTVTATLSNLNASPLPKYFSGVYPTAGELAETPVAALAAFQSEINIYSTQIVGRKEDGGLTDKEFLELSDALEGMNEAYRILNNATASEQAFDALSESARAAVQVAQDAAVAP